MLQTPTIFWMITVSFVLFQFFIQLSSGLVISSIMQDLALSASKAGLLSSVYYYVYTSLQIPVGILFDKKDTRALLAYNALLCSISCFLFTNSHHFMSLMISRFMIGAGSAFAFVGLSHVLRQHYQLQAFGFMIGLSETLAFLVTVVFMILMGTADTGVDWRYLMQTLGYIGLIITVFLFILLPKQASCQPTPKHSLRKELVSICLSPTAWINGLFIGLGFTLITVFGAMWAIPFIQLKTGCTLQTTSVIDAMLFLGTGISCPLFGMLEARIPYRRSLLFISYFFTAGLFLFVLYGPTTSPILLGGLFGLLGLCSGAYMLGYTIANEISPPESQSTSTGFANTLAMLSAPFLQPLVGYLLDNTPGGYTLSNYQHALLLVPVCIFIGGCLVVFLPRKPQP